MKDSLSIRFSFPYLLVRLLFDTKFININEISIFLVIYLFIFQGKLFDSTIADEGTWTLGKGNL